MRPASTWSPSSTTDSSASTAWACCSRHASAVGWSTSSRRAGPPPTSPLTTTEADAVTEQLARAGTHLVCLNSWQPGDGTPPAWWNDEEGAWMRQLDALREEERRQREQASETGADSQVNQAGRTGNASQSIEPSKEVHYA